MRCEWSLIVSTGSTGPPHNHEFSIAYRRWKVTDLGTLPLYDEEWERYEWLDVTTHSDPPDRKFYVRGKERT